MDNSVLSPGDSDTDFKIYTFADRLAETNMGDRTAFFYGTLMAQEVLYRVIFGVSALSKHHHSAQTITSTPAILHDHRRSRVKYADYPGVIPDKGHSVRGTYVTGLTDGDIYRLDTFEGSQYTLQNVRVKLLKKEGDEVTGEGNVEGNEVDTQTYIWIAPEDDLEDKEWDYATFRKEKMKYWVGNSVEFDEVDAAAKEMEETGTDPTGGRGAGGHISKALEEHHAKENEPFKSAV